MNFSQNTDPALLIAKKAISLINDKNTQVYNVPKVIESRDNVAAAVYLYANGGTAETVKIHSEQGTSTTSIHVVSDDGGVSLNAGNGVYIVGNRNGANAVYIHANGGTAESIFVRADKGTANTSVNVQSDVGGITLNAGSNLVMTAASNSANTVSISVDAGTAESILIKSAQGTSNGSISLVSTAGGITLDADEGLVLTADSGVLFNSIAAFNATSAAVAGSALGLGNTTVTSGDSSDNIAFKANGAINCTSYLRVYIGSTAYYIPLIASNPQTV
jgi:hypothetical protein